MFRRNALQSALALATVAALGACASQSPTPTQTVAGTMAHTPALSTFQKLVDDAGLAATLNAAGPYTVFAPSDDAFKAVPAKTLNALTADKKQLMAMLNYHIVPGALTAADIKPGNAKTLQGANVVIARAGSFVAVEDALVEKSDLQASNGVVHIVDRVLMPPKQ